MSETKPQVSSKVDRILKNQAVADLQEKHKAAPPVRPSFPGAKPTKTKKDVEGAVKAFKLPDGVPEVDRYRWFGWSILVGGGAPEGFTDIEVREALVARGLDLVALEAEFSKADDEDDIDEEDISSEAAVALDGSAEDAAALESTEDQVEEKTEPKGRTPKAVPKKTPAASAGVASDDKRLAGIIARALRMVADAIEKDPEVLQ